MKAKEIIKHARKSARKFRSAAGCKFHQNDFKSRDTPGFAGEHKSEAREALANGVQLLGEFQEKLYACEKWSLRLSFQAMAAAGRLRRKRPRSRRSIEEERCHNGFNRLSSPKST